jgi:hypothetical protein
LRGFKKSSDRHQSLSKTSETSDRPKKRAKQADTDKDTDTDTEKDKENYLQANNYLLL